MSFIVALDDYIPFCEFFVIPYYLWFVYMAIGILFIAFTDGKLCWRMGIFLITGYDCVPFHLGDISERTATPAGKLCKG